jgi:putative protease
MKSPSYVGYITRIYRKLIDNYKLGIPLELTEEEQDNLKILFNREFTLGYLFNDKVMNTKSSNHQGLEIGEVLDITPKKIKIKLTKDLYQEDDTISSFTFNRGTTLPFEIKIESITSTEAKIKFTKKR